MDSLEAGLALLEWGCLALIGTVAITAGRLTGELLAAKLLEILARQA